MPQPHKIIVGNGQDRSLHFCFNIQTEFLGTCSPKNSYFLTPNFPSSLPPCYQVLGLSLQGFAGGVQGLGVLRGHFFGLFVAGQAFQVLFCFFNAVFGVLIQLLALFTAKGGIDAVDGGFRGIQGLDGGALRS